VTSRRQQQREVFIAEPGGWIRMTVMAPLSGIAGR